MERWKQQLNWIEDHVKKLVVPLGWSVWVPIEFDPRIVPPCDVMELRFSYHRKEGKFAWTYSIGLPSIIHMFHGDESECKRYALDICMKLMKEMFDLLEKEEK